MAWIWKNVVGDGKNEAHQHIVVSASQAEKIKQDFGGVEDGGSLSKCPWVNSMNKLKLLIKPEKEADGDADPNSMVHQNIQIKATDHVVQNAGQTLFPLKPWHHFNRDLLKPQQLVGTSGGNKDELPWRDLDGQGSRKNGEK